MNSLFAVSAGTIAYLVGLSFSIYERKIRKKLLLLVISGIVIGSIFSTAIVTLFIELAHYNTPPSATSLLLYAPVAEESAKFLGLFFFWLLLSKKVAANEFEVVRFAGGIGLGFGVFEAISYVVAGASFEATISRLLVSIPFHISSAMLISFGFAEKKSALVISLLMLAVVFHSLSNFLAVYNALLQGIVFWILLTVLYFLSEELYNRS